MNLSWRLALAAGVMLILAGVLPAITRAAPGLSADFADWHLPLPAGEWGISRGPCGSAARFNHSCRYYEERCAVDFVPLSGSMEGAPVLAPQAGQVLFAGLRTDGGLTLMLRHADERVSVLMHLSKIVVGLDTAVQQGQVIGYAGSTGSSGNPHVHFYVQPNAVQRECVPIDGIDDLDYLLRSATSHNAPWTRLAVPDPPAALPGWLATLPTPESAADALTPARMELVARRAITLPVAIPHAAGAVDWLVVGGQWLRPMAQTSRATVFDVPLRPEVQGDYAVRMWTRTADGRLDRLATRLNYSVKASNTVYGPEVILINPAYESPGAWTSHTGAPLLCWSIHSQAGAPPLRFRVLLAGGAARDSGWIDATCWQPRDLSAGTYYWKVFVRDAAERMNRTNQRPAAFIVH